MSEKEEVSKRDHFRYNCTENDNHIIFMIEDEEIWVGNCLEEEHIVIGIEDLKKAMSVFNERPKRKISVQDWEDMGKDMGISRANVIMDRAMVDKERFENTIKKKTIFSAICGWFCSDCDRMEKKITVSHYSHEVKMDDRLSPVYVACSGHYEIGDKVKISYNGIPLQSLSLSNEPTGRDQVFTVVEKSGNNHIGVIPFIKKEMDIKKHK